MLTPSKSGHVLVRLPGLLNVVVMLNSNPNEENRIYRYRSYARKFIRDLATDDDLRELQKMIAERLGE